MMKRLLLLLSLLAAALSAAGQEARPWEALFADLSTLDDMESGDWEDTYEMLCELEQAPIDLNSASPSNPPLLPSCSVVEPLGSNSNIKWSLVSRTTTSVSGFT